MVPSARVLFTTSFARTVVEIFVHRDRLVADFGPSKRRRIIKLGRAREIGYWPHVVKRRRRGVVVLVGVGRWFCGWCGHLFIKNSAGNIPGKIHAPASKEKMADHAELESVSSWVKYVDARAFFLKTSVGRCLWKTYFVDRYLTKSEAWFFLYLRYKRYCVVCALPQKPSSPYTKFILYTYTRCCKKPICTTCATTWKDTCIHCNIKSVIVEATKKRRLEEMK